MIFDKGGFVSWGTKPFASTSNPSNPSLPFFLRMLFTGWWFGTFVVFPYVENFIIPIDEFIFFRGVETNQQPDYKHMIFVVSSRNLIWTPKIAVAKRQNPPIAVVFCFVPL